MSPPAASPAFPVVVLRCLAYLVLPTDQISDDEVPIACLHVTSPPQPMLLLPHLPTVMEKFPFCVFHTVLFWFRVMVMLRFLSSTPVLLAFPLPPSFLFFALNLPCRLAAAADALLGMINSDKPLLLLHHHPYLQARWLQHEQKVATCRQGMWTSSLLTRFEAPDTQGTLRLPQEWRDRDSGPGVSEGEAMSTEEEANRY
jgi:hypothetical protein